MFTNLEGRLLNCRSVADHNALKSIAPCVTLVEGCVSTPKDIYLYIYIYITDNCRLPRVRMSHHDGFSDQESLWSGSGSGSSSSSSGSRRASHSSSSSRSSNYSRSPSPRDYSSQWGGSITSVTRRVNGTDNTGLRFFEHVLRGPFAAETTTYRSKKHQHPRPRSGAGGRQSSRNLSPPSPPAPIFRGPPAGPMPPPPPPPQQMRMGGPPPMGGAPGFIHLNGPVGGRPAPPPMRGPGPAPDPIWGRPPMPRYGQPPRPTAEVVNE